MKRLIQSLAVVGFLTIAVTACNSTRNASDTRDSMAMDSTMTSTMDTTRTTTPPDTTNRQ